MPSPPADLVGREEEIALLTAAVRAGGHAVGLVTGMGGAGKTSVVVSVAQAVAADFRDGQLWACLRGSTEEPAGADEVLAGFLTALGVPADRIPDGLSERAALYRSVLAGRSVLVVLDDARDAAQLTPLLPGAAGCAVLISARSRPAIGVTAAVRLDCLRPAESARLVCAILGADRAGTEPEAVAALTAACGELPLAVRVLATRLARRPAWTVASMAARVSDDSRLLGELEAADAGFENACDLAFGRLTGAQARALLALVATPSQDWSLTAAAATMGLPEAQAERILEALVDAALLTSPGPPATPVTNWWSPTPGSGPGREREPERESAGAERPWLRPPGPGPERAGARWRAPDPVLRQCVSRTAASRGEPGCPPPPRAPRASGRSPRLRPGRHDPGPGGRAWRG